MTKSLVEYLRNQIITGELAAGQKLNENHLSSRLDISRPPLREAFRILEHEHLVVSIPRKGTYVSNISIEDLQEVYQAREMIECYTIDLLKAKNIRDLPNVESALAKASDLSLPSTLDSEQLFIYYETMTDFHVKLVGSAGNFRMIYFYQAISSNLARYQYMHFSIPGTGRRSLEDHQQVLDFVKIGACDQAKECLRDHINYSFEFQRGILESKISEKKLDV